MKRLALILFALAISHSTYATSTADNMADDWQKIFSELNQPQASSSMEVSLTAPPATPRDLMLLLKTISEKFLLLDASFQNDEKLSRLFGPADLVAPYTTEQESPGLAYRIWKPKENSVFRNQFKTIDIAISAGRYKEKSPAISAASLRYSSAPGNPLDFPLILPVMAV